MAEQTSFTKHYNPDIYVPPSDDEEEAAAHYLEVVTGTDDSGLLDNFEVTNSQANYEISTSQAVNAANSLLYDDVLNQTMDTSESSQSMDSRSPSSGSASPNDDVVSDNEIVDVAVHVAVNAVNAVNNDNVAVNAVNNDNVAVNAVNNDNVAVNAVNNGAVNAENVESSSSEEEEDSLIEPDEADDDEEQTIAAAPTQNLQFTPIHNFQGDVEHEDDFANGWEWIVGEDPGPAVEDCTAYQGLNLPPADRTPGAFFKLLFDETMYSLIADETNRYAQRRKQGNFNFFSFFIYV